MKRRSLLQLGAVLGAASAGVRVEASEAGSKPSTAPRAAPAQALRPPADGKMPVAFLLSDDAVVIDFAGPWEVFENVHLPGGLGHPFELHTVAESAAPVRAGGGLTILPGHTFATAPPPKILVIPAQGEPSAACIDWIRRVAPATDLTMSVCTGAFVLARTGLLAGKEVATHHRAYAELAMAYPDVFVRRGARFVESGNLASSGGLSSGIDLALHVVERYFGRAVALATADNLEYQGQGWLDANSNRVYARPRRSAAGPPLCPVCDMEVDPASAPSSVLHAKTWYFCMASHKKLFDTAPERFVAG